VALRFWSRVTSMYILTQVCNDVCVYLSAAAALVSFKLNVLLFRTAVLHL
jgi:hypothetical protein